MTASSYGAACELISLLRGDLERRFADLLAAEVGITSVSGMLSIYLWEDGRRMEVAVPCVGWWRIPEGMTASSYASTR
jgi:hypothetical protein